MTPLKASLFLAVAFLFIPSCDAECKVVPCKDCPVKFEASFSPCPIQRGGFVNVSAHGIAPTDMSGITYDVEIFSTEGTVTPIMGVSGSSDCKTVAKLKLPLMCPVKKGAQLFLKNQPFRIPKRMSLDRGSYRIHAKAYDTTDKRLVVCAVIDFDLI